jgi:hypothetical protein
VTLVAGQRVLVKDQTNAAENGTFIAASGFWSRSADELAQGAKVEVLSGSGNQGSKSTLTTREPIDPGTTPLSWVLSRRTESLSFTTPLQRNGSTVSLPDGSPWGGSKLTAAIKDGPAASPSLRTLGTGAQQATPARTLVSATLVLRRHTPRLTAQMARTR